MLAVLTHTVLAVVAIVGDQAPRIDVWVVLQQGADALGRGDNLYTQQWTDSPGVQDFFPYLPWMAVLTAPGRWLAGDVRWAVLVWSLVLFAGLWALARRTGRACRCGHGGARARSRDPDPGRPGVDRAGARRPARVVGACSCGVATPGGRWCRWPWPARASSTSRSSPRCSSSGGRSARAAPSRRGGLAAVLILPWVVADPAAFLGDTVTTLLTFHPIRFANTWYLYALNEHGVTLPFAVTGAAMVGAVAVTAYAVWRRRPDVAELLRWLALVLAVANLVNKQAFYNQFWLVGALVAASLAVRPQRGSATEPDAGRSEPSPASTGRGRARPLPASRRREVRAAVVPRHALRGPGRSRPRRRHR